jgi:hypothetical protein
VEKWVKTELYSVAVAKLLFWKMSSSSARDAGWWG